MKDKKKSIKKSIKIDYKYAGYGRKFLAFFIDFIVVWLFSIFSSLIEPDLFGSLFILIVWIFYFIILEKNSRTFGKTITNLEIIYIEDYGKKQSSFKDLTYGDLITRQILTTILIIFLTIPIGWMYFVIVTFFNKQNRLFNDNSSKTMLICPK